MTQKRRRHWLVKSEPGDYSIDDLARDGSTHWTGVRNYQARNLMRDEMSAGDLVLYYHSGGDREVVGLARVVGPPVPDATQFDPKSPYFDPAATPDVPRWWLVEVEFVEKFARAIPLREIKENPELSEMTLVSRSRLSVQPVSESEFEIVRAMVG